jgi:hypothetical protein
MREMQMQLSATLHRRREYAMFLPDFRCFLAPGVVVFRLMSAAWFGRRG